MMVKKPGVAKTFAGRWRLVEMDSWDNDYLDFLEDGHLTFGKNSEGHFSFGTVEGFLDVRYGVNDGSPCAEFSWEGHDEGNPISGRGWMMIGASGDGVGHLYMHNSEDSAFVCRRRRKRIASTPKSATTGNRGAAKQPGAGRTVKKAGKARRKRIVDRLT
ncbi:MAG: hypothetical protein FWD68_18330 [Alphaproteobacteria bacterium]|nr:hypothetical protein [Alphaproteobacteria bacterium]